MKLKSKNNDTKWAWIMLMPFMIFFVLIGLLASARKIGMQSLTETTQDADSCDIDFLIRK